MSWIFYAILAAFIWAVTNIFDKYVLNRLQSRAHIPFLIQGIVGGIAGLILLPFHWSIPFNAGFILLIIITAACFAALNYWYFRAADLTEMSRVVPLFYISPIVVAFLAAIFLDERFAPITYLGIILIVVGAILISLKRQGKTTVSKNALWFIAGCILADGFSEIISKYLMRSIDYWALFTYIRLTASLITLPFIIHYWGEIRSVWKSKERTAIVLSTLSETVNLSAVLFFTIAIAYGYVTLANALAATQPFFVLLFTVLISLFYPAILKEEIDKKTVGIKLMAIILVFAGILMIR